jgi:hypothetical protein
MTDDELRLSSESAIDIATRERRRCLVAQLNRLPDEAFTRLQYLQVQVGCFNRCAFCSQEAGADVWQVSERGLADLVAAIVNITRRRGIGLGADRTIHRPGVMFPYLDNDIASYTYFGQLVQHCARDLRTRLRISTVGYSRHNRHLTDVHRRVVADDGRVIDGIRFSLTPYTAGYRTNRNEYIADLAAALRTWKPYFERVGPGAATGAVELRFAPLIHAVDAQLFDEIVDGRHIVAVGPHLLVSARTVSSRPEPTTITAVQGREAAYSRAGEPYIHLTSDRIITGSEPAEVVRLLLGPPLVGPHSIRNAILYAWSNFDGPYYAVNPAFAPDGRYRALHLYLRSERRRRCGYTDATRFFLNELLAQKAASGIGRRHPFPHATAADVQAVLERIAARARQIGPVDRRASRHIIRQVLPLVEAYAIALERADYPPSAFFDRNFTIDTGQIVNQGRALTLFRGLAATEDEPMTPREDRGYGDVSLSSMRGTVWRIAPSPTEIGSRFRIGGKNAAQRRPSLVVEELDPRHLRPVRRITGEPLRRYVICGVDTERLSLTDADALHAYPGAAK